MIAGRRLLVVAALLAGCVDPATKPPDQPSAARRETPAAPPDAFDASDWAALAETVADRERLAIRNPRGVDAWNFAVLRDAARLTRLRLERGGDDTLADALADAAAIETLNLPAAELSDDGLRTLAGIASLRSLRIGGVSPSADAVDAFAQADRLRHLHLLDATLAADAVAAIGRIGSLQSLYLDRVLLTDDALAKLVAARPDLHLHINARHVEDVR